MRRIARASRDGLGLPTHFSMRPIPFIARNLAAAFLDGAWSKEAILQRAVLACGRKTRWITLLVNRVLKAFPESSSQRTQEPIARFIEAQPIFRKAVRSYLPEEGCAFHQLFWVTPTMSPRPGAPESWQVPPLTTSTALANWLNLKPAQLDWFADCHGFEAKLPEGSLRHYMYRWIAKQARKYRLLEIPKPRLKSFQRQILHEILDRIPCHDAVHGFRKGRSIVTYAGPHCGHASSFASICETSFLRSQARGFMRFSRPPAIPPMLPGY